MWTCQKCGEKIEDQFDSCWKCAEKPEQAPAPTRHLTWSFFASAALAAILAPLLADSLHLLFVFESGRRFYEADSASTAAAWFAGVFEGIRVAITFLILWICGRHGFRDRTVWLCLVVLWLFVDTLLQPAVVK
jgi:hypothetical protein